MCTPFTWCTVRLYQYKRSFDIWVRSTLWLFEMFNYASILCYSSRLSTFLNALMAQRDTGSVEVLLQTHFVQTFIHSHQIFSGTKSLKYTLWINFGNFKNYKQTNSARLDPPWSHLPYVRPNWVTWSCEFVKQEKISHHRCFKRAIAFPLN